MRGGPIIGPRGGNGPGLGNGIEPTGMKWMTSGDPLDSQPDSSNNTEPGDGVQCVLRAARLKATARAQVGTYQFLVGSDQEGGNLSWDPGQTGQGSFQTCPRSGVLLWATNGFPASEIQATRVANGTWGTVAPAITTKS